jgi:hypothetical protein
VAVVSCDRLKPGQRVRITQTVRVGRRSWLARSSGIVRDVQMLLTGLSTQRAPDDIVAVPTVHFVKENGELASIVVDEHTQIELLDALA